MIGKRLGPYEITAKVGEGGMGEVYRARDTKLDRDVAIKVLPAAFTADPDRLARFEREAKLLAQLHHPHVASIFGLEEADGVQALVMELVEGPTLSERLASGPIPVEEALAIARQIAEALEVAHEKGIVHRDLKPDNVKLTADGSVKILDFGLAKALEPTDTLSSPNLTNSPTLAASATVQGTILGTAAYMAPEQARGRAVDKRADIWAFGVVLFEMLTGRRLFDGETVTDLLASVLRKEIDFAELPRSLPSSVVRLIRRCLDRDPKRRLRDIGEARILLEEPPPDERAPAVPARKGRELVAWSLVVLLAAAAFAIWHVASREAPRPQVIRSTVPLPGDVTVELDGERCGMPAVSPDGRRIAFAARQGRGPERIWVHDLDTGNNRVLEGTDFGYRPFWSPDGKWIGFFDASHLVKTPADGGPTVDLAPAYGARGGTWNTDDQILYSPHPYGPLWLVSARGGAPHQETTLPADVPNATQRFPQFLPDGKHYLFLARIDPLGHDSASGIFVGELGSPEHARLLERRSNAVYAAGRLLSVESESLVARAFDPETRRIEGQPQTLVENLLINRRFSFGIFSAVDSDLLVFLTGRLSNLSELVWYDRSGRKLGEVGTPGILSGLGGLAISRDGHWAAVSRVEPGGIDADIWLYDLERGSETRISRPKDDDSDPVFSPDSRLLYFASRIEFGRSIMIRRRLADGGEETVWSGKNADFISPATLSPDERAVVATFRDRNMARDVVSIDLAGAAAADAAPLVVTPANEFQAQISADGRWMAWVSDESGRDEVYVAPYPSLSGPTQVSRAGGTEPRWRADGRELFFKDLKNFLTAVPVEGEGGSFSIGEPKPLFQIIEFYGATYAVTADGSRFLVRVPRQEQEISPVTLLTDWTATLDSK